MSNDIPKSPFNNEFIRQHVRDDQYEQIVREVTTRKPGSKTGKKIKLTSQMLREYLFYVSIGESVKNAAIYSGIGESYKDDLHAESPTFASLQSLAEGNLTLRSKIAVYRAIEGQMPQYYEITHPVTGEKRYIELKEIPPNVTVAQWHLEKSGAYGKSDSEDAPQLGAPRNEEEAKLLEMLLNRHYDYVKAKESQSVK